ncbi:hypothetical protein [Spiroplasma endosymbiont of Seladonia tumulorum]|uniref:hypothetical protein n=1 Tax=Spiroplasma endosymbiont of Seladonia tumulorum TaxID=3066321 RepID=UPI0030D0F3F1
MQWLRTGAGATAIDIKESIKEHRHWMVFPFNVYSSYIPGTETGWKPNNAKPSDYGSYSRIFDNMESTIAQWQGSLKIVQKYKGEEINILTIDDFKNQPINSTIWANNETPFAIKLKDENNNVYWKLIDGENIYDISVTINNIISTQALSYFRRKDEFGNTVGQVQIEYNKMGKCNVWDILNMNNFINRQITVLPLNYTQKLVFNPFTIPAIGKFLNFVSFGIPWDWIGNLTITQDDKWPNFPWLNGFMSANVYSFYNDAFWGDKAVGKGYLPFEIFREQGNDKIGAMIGANASSFSFTTLLTDKIQGNVFEKDGKPTERITYSTYNLKQLNPKTNRIYLINELVRAVDAQTPVSDSEKDNDCEFLQTPDGANCSYIIDMFSIQALYKGNFEIIFYADNPYTNNEEDYLKLSVWSFRGKTKSTLNNYLRDMTTNYKTSFLLPHNYEIPTFNYPKYVLPPVPYNYQPYTKDIMPAGVVQTLKTKITAQAQCKENFPSVNLFDNTAEYKGYYEIEIDLKQIDPTIQSISKFQDAYKTIEINNLGNLQVECGQPDIENFIPNRNVDILGGLNCNSNLGSLANIILQQSGRSQTDKVNFDNIITLYTDNIRVNDIQTFSTGYTNELTGDDYENRYFASDKRIVLNFLLQITKLSNNDSGKITETYLQAYYTNDLKLKIRISKIININLLLDSTMHWKYFGNNKEIVLDVSNPNVLGIRNKSENPVKITFIPR